MIVNQLSVFLENKRGRLTEVFDSLASARIDLTACSIADTSEYGILRLIVSDPAGAREKLRQQGFTVNISEVLMVHTPTKAEAIARVLRLLSEAGLSIEYLYAFSVGDKEVVVIRTEKIENAIEILTDHKLELVRASDLYKL